jgi:hypothetical protein
LSDAGIVVVLDPERPFAAFHAGGVVQAIGVSDSDPEGALVSLFLVVVFVLAVLVNVSELGNRGFGVIGLAGSVDRFLVYGLDVLLEFGR